MRQVLKKAAIALLLLLLLAAGLVGWAISALDASGPSVGQTTVVVPKSTPTPEIARLLEQAGVIEQPWLFVAAAHLPERRLLKAGEYSFPAHIGMQAVLDMMTRGDIVVHKFTLVEGETVAQVMGHLRGIEALTGKPLQTPDEGSLLPETYFFSFGESRETLINRMIKAMNDAIDADWPKRQPGLPLADKIEAVILASIVERETAIPEERPRVAAVFLNRLRLHVRLQSDPTVVYALSNGLGLIDRPLTREDLAIDSPYNTYKVEGLPPGPICNPGPASLNAVLHPAATDDLYFVADGSGGHVFSKTLADHNRNVARYRQMERGEMPPPALKKIRSAR